MTNIRLEINNQNVRFNQECTIKTDVISPPINSSSNINNFIINNPKIEIRQEAIPTVTGGIVTNPVAN